MKTTFAIILLIYAFSPSVIAKDEKDTRERATAAFKSGLAKQQSGDLNGAIDEILRSQKQ